MLNFNYQVFDNMSWNYCKWFITSDWIEHWHWMNKSALVVIITMLYYYYNYYYYLNVVNILCKQIMSAALDFTSDIEFRRV